MILQQIAGAALMLACLGEILLTVLMPVLAPVAERRKWEPLVRRVAPALGYQIGEIYPHRPHGENA